MFQKFAFVSLGFRKLFLQKISLSYRFRFLPYILLLNVVLGIPYCFPASVKLYPFFTASIASCNCSGFHDGGPKLLKKTLIFLGQTVVKICSKDAGTASKGSLESEACTEKQKKSLPFNPFL